MAHDRLYLRQGRAPGLFRNDDKDRMRGPWKRVNGLLFWISARNIGTVRRSPLLRPHSEKQTHIRSIPQCDDPLYELAHNWFRSTVHYGCQIGPQHLLDQHDRRDQLLAEDLEQHLFACKMRINRALFDTHNRQTSSERRWPSASFTKIPHHYRTTQV
jgi:hypothetical protein